VVKEIEEAVHQEMEAACTMLEDRPQSPLSFAQARTNVVMETQELQPRQQPRSWSGWQPYQKKLDEASKWISTC